MYPKDFSLVPKWKHFPFSLFSFPSFLLKKCQPQKHTQELLLLSFKVQQDVQYRYIYYLCYSIEGGWRPNHNITCTSTTVFRSISMRQTVVRVKLYPERANKATKPMRNTNIIVLQMFIFKTGIHTQTTNPRTFKDIRRREVPNSFWQ